MIDDAPRSHDHAMSDGLPDTVASSPYRVLTRWPWTGAILAAILIVVCFGASQQLQFDRSIASMFDPDDPALISYLEFQSDFGGNSIAMIVYQDLELWTNEGMERNTSITHQAAQLQGIAGVLSPAVLNDAVKQLRPGSFLSKNQPLLNKKDPVARGFDRMFAGYTHSRDHTQGVIVAMLEPEKVGMGIEGLRRLVADIESNSTLIQSPVLIGEPVLVEQAFDLIQRDGARLAQLTVALLSVVVLVSLLDLRLVILSILVIGWSVTVTRASLFYLGINLSMVSTILTAVTTVIAVTAVLHIGVRYRIARRRGRNVAAAMTTAMVFLVIPVLLTCLTDAAGFAALSASLILPVRQFGWMIAISACCVFIALMLMGPLVMQLPSFQPLARLADSFRNRGLHRVGNRAGKAGWILARWAIQHSKWMLFVVLAALAILPYAMSRLETETTFLNNFEAQSDLVRAYNRVEQDLGGAGVWDVILDAPPKLNNRYLNKVRKLEHELRKIDIEGVRLTKVISIADADRVLTNVPLLRRLTQLRLKGMQATMPVFYKALVTTPMQRPSALNSLTPSSLSVASTQPPPGRKLRLMLRSEEEMESHQKIQLIQAVEETVFASELGENAKVTGYYVLMARLIDQLVADGWRCCFASAVLVWVVLLISGRSIKRATVALVVNLLPAFVVIASVGIFGNKINMGSAMIAAVSIGLSIDGSVHFLTGYRRKRRRGHRPEQSAEYAAANIGVPMLLATAALVVGFGGLITSEFVPTSTFGVLIAATLSVGTIVNLTILPALIAKVDSLGKILK